MPTLTREDNVQFAIHPYRELLLSTQRGSLLKAKIRQLAEHHGEYIRLIKHSNSQIEAVFSREPGFLLGESVWHHFGKPNNLIYCEALPEGKQAILVVVRSGMVYLDTKMPCDSIPEELMSLLASQNPYDIYISGDVPISEHKTAGKFHLEPKLVNSFNQLDGDLFPVLNIQEQYQLQPLDVGLRSGEFHRNYLPWILLVIAMMALAFWQTRPDEQQKKPHTSQHRIIMNSYQLLRHSPDPRVQLNDISYLARLGSTIPGWEVKQLNSDGYHTTLEVRSMGGPYHVIQRWSRRYHASWRMNGNQVQLGFYKQHRPRQILARLNNLDDVMVDMIDRIQHILPYNAIEVGQFNRQGKTRQVRVNILLQKLSPGILALVGQQLAGMPVKLNAIHLALANGLLTGAIQITIVGK